MMVELAKKFTIKYPTCRKVRLVRKGNSYYRQISLGEPLASWQGICATCSMRASVRKHREAIERLEKKISANMFRGR
jgi:hypothetical protein